MERYIFLFYVHKGGGLTIFSILLQSLKMKCWAKKLYQEKNQLIPGSKSVGVGVILKRLYSFLCKENAKDDS